MIKDFYYIKDGKAYLVGKSTTDEILKDIRTKGFAKTNGYKLYPIHSAPGLTDCKRIVATVVNDGGAEEARWYWQVKEHKKNDPCCEIIPYSGGLCAVKVLRYLQWNKQSTKWDLEPMVNAATPEQIRCIEH